MRKIISFSIGTLILSFCLIMTASAQTPPNDRETSNYSPFLKAVYDGNLADVDRVLVHHPKYSGS